MCREVDRCRICGNTHLQPILNLGSQYLTGVFPRNRDYTLTRGPLELVKCHGERGGDHCGLVQLRHSFPAAEMYGQNYGYRSSLNRSMVEHLRAKAQKLSQDARLRAGDLVLDIGSNDGTLLSCFQTEGLTRVGIDPSAAKFRHYYPPDVEAVPDFFSADLFRSRFPGRKAKLITSIAMFYDLEQPMDFVRQIADILADDGLWHLEQSYLPLMLSQNSYDTICHEHVEYYALRQIKWMTDRCGLKIVDIALNDVNGGSFAVSVARAGAAHAPHADTVQQALDDEDARGFDTPAPYDDFHRTVFAHRDDLRSTLKDLRARGKKILGYGASTKGNVLLQFCDITPDDLPCIAEVNEDKFGCFTPGTNIPIVSEAEARNMKPDIFLVLPWHFRPAIIDRERAFLASGGRLLFPLPHIEEVAR